MIKRILKIVLVPIAFALAPAELILWGIVWIITGRKLQNPAWWKIAVW